TCASAARCYARRRPPARSPRQRSRRLAVSAAEPRGEHRNPWTPRVGRETGKVGFVKLHDDLALAIIGARLASPKSLAVLLAIFWRHQRTYRDAEPVAVGRHELAKVIGCAPSSVQAALRE